MTSLSEFERDLRKVAIESANFMRRKSSKLNEERNFEELYSGEREFVAECYRRLVNLNEEYLHNLLIEYYKPQKNEKNPEPVFPDIVFHNSKSGRTAVEVKPVWHMPTRIDDLYQSDKDRILGDYEKLKDHYRRFDSKILLVPFWEMRTIISETPSNVTWRL